jgi:hypothetical protein
MLSGIQAPPSDATVFTLLPGSGLRNQPFETQIDAMIIAQKYNLSTINGYSGYPPRGWNVTHDINDSLYPNLLNRWILYHQLNNDHFYFLNLKTGKWSPGKESSFTKPNFFPFMTGAIIKDSDFAVQLSLLEIPDQWKINETRDCQLRAINNGNVSLSSIVADIQRPDLYGITLAYRWVKRNEVNELDPEDFPNRWSLSSSAPIKKELTWFQLITAPPEAGSYYLEIEMIQENVAWFKSKGYPGIKVKVDIL